jgi:predicted RNase H-like HicB family nuclease
MARYVGLIDGERGAYGVAFPDCPGCTAMGATVEEALHNSVDALAEWVADELAESREPPVARGVDAVRADPEVSAALAEGAALVVVPLVVEAGRPARANLSIDAGLLAAIDEAAEARGLTRSAFLASAARDKIVAGG